ncbi:hypothetical protein [Alloalcanivorax xenomutans]|uniref:hypothetical protein n=1 Tax=Alloalcanivorax xenomutans TaxID=1094342 RepID=UPI0011AB898E|nr:hypothetical protein [Alloalcanivorax xenomutans]
MFFSVVVAGYCIFEVYGGDLGKWIAYFLYKRDYKEIISNKSTGPFGITYYLSFFLLLPFCIFFCRFLSGAGLASLFGAALVFFAALISQSRTGLFSYLFAMLVSVVLVGVLNGRRGVVMFVISLPIVTIMGSYFYMNYQEILSDFSYLNAGISFVFEGNVDFSGGGEGSANVRLHQIYFAIKNMHFGGVFGSGLAKDGSILLESLYALYLYRYGFLGLFLFFFVIFMCIKSSWGKSRFFRVTSDHSRFSLYVALSAFFMSVPLALFSSAMQDGPKLSFFFYGAIACALCTSNKVGQETGAQMKNLNGSDLWRN